MRSSTAPEPKKTAEDAQVLRRSRGGLSTKIHATVDAQGQPTQICLTAGQASDLDGTDTLLPMDAGRTLIADKGYDAAQRVVAPTLAAGKAVVIPSIRDGRPQRDFDQTLYRLRHRIENFFARVKQWRAIATCYDKTAQNFLVAIHLVCAMTWMTRFTDTP